MERNSTTIVLLLLFLLISHIISEVKTFDKYVVDDETNGEGILQFYSEEYHSSTKGSNDSTTMLSYGDTINEDMKKYTQDHQDIKDYIKKNEDDYSMNVLMSLEGMLHRGGPSFNPKNQNEMIYLSNENKGVLQIFKVNLSFKERRIIGKPEQLTNKQNRCSSARYLRNGNILFLHDRGGDEQYQIGLLNDKNQLNWITSASPKSKNFPLMTSRRYFYYSSNRENGKVIKIYRRPLPAEKHPQRWDNDEVVFVPRRGIATISMILDRKETKFLLHIHFSNAHSELVLYDMKTKRMMPFTSVLDGNHPTKWSLIKVLGKKKNRFLVKTDFKSDFFRPAILKVKNLSSLFHAKSEAQLKKKISFSPIPSIEKVKHDFLSIKFHRSKAYLQINDNGFSTIFESKFNRRKPYGLFGNLKKVPMPLKRAVILQGDSRTYGHGISLTKDGHYMALTLSNAKMPSSIFIIDLKDPASKSWNVFPQSYPDYISPSELSDAKLYSIKSFDGTRIPYFLYAPKYSKGPHPTIIILHGGPESQSKPYFIPTTQFLILSGFTVVYPNIRGSNGYGKRYLSLDNKEKRMDAIRDIAELAKKLPTKHRHLIDGDNLILMGGSYGGYATLLSLVTYPKLWRAGVDIVGMSSLITFFKHTAAWRRRLRAPEYGDYNTQKTFLRSISPIYQVHQIQCPVFIIQGTNDERVPASEAVSMYKKIREVGKEKGNHLLDMSNLLIFDDEGHGLSKLKNKLFSYHKLVHWLRQVLRSQHSKQKNF